MEVTSGVPQESVLAPIMFVIYMNDMTEGVTSYMNMFADDAKLLRRVTNEEDCVALNQDLDGISEWVTKMGNNIQHEKVQCAGIWQEHTKECKGIKSKYRHQQPCWA